VCSSDLFYRVKQLQHLLSTGMVDADLRWSHTTEPEEVNLGARQ
jgi:hypothetical protein